MHVAHLPAKRRWNQRSGDLDTITVKGNMHFGNDSFNPLEPWWYYGRASYYVRSLKKQDGDTQVKACINRVLGDGGQCQDRRTSTPETTNLPGHFWRRENIVKLFLLLVFACSCRYQHVSPCPSDKYASCEHTDSREDADVSRQFFWSGYLLPDEAREGRLVRINELTTWRSSEECRSCVCWCCSTSHVRTLCYEDKLAKLTKCFDGYSRRYQFRGVKLLCLVMTCLICYGHHSVFVFQERLDMNIIISVILKVYRELHQHHPPLPVDTD
jgi:hypothetical protein